MLNTRKSIWLQLAVVAIACRAGAQIPANPPAHDGFCFHGAGVTLPTGKFLLMRKGDQLGAIRITRITPDTRTVPRGGEWLGTVSYSSYFLSGKATLSNAPEYSADLHFGRYKGVGFHHSWQSGNHQAQVGPWKLAFFSPNGVFMTSVDFWNGINHDGGFQFAATSATSITAVDPGDPHLHWYGYDNNRDSRCPEPLPTIHNQESKH